MKIGNREFDTVHHTYVMGILNVTPDSFSDGGKYNGMDAALKHAEQMIADGVDIIDVGGESTRLGYTKISDEEEIGRVTPVLEALKKHFDIPLSLDTYKSKVAQAGLDAGADLINDIWGLKYDTRMADVIAKSKKACCLMHNREEAQYTDFRREIMGDLMETLQLAQKAGIAALKEEEYVKRSMAYVHAQRKKLIKNLTLLGYKTFDSKANYIFFQGEEGLYEKCLEKGILIRDCSNYYGLKKGYYRVAVKLQEENEKLLEVLKACRKDGEKWQKRL